MARSTAAPRRILSRCRITADRTARTQPVAANTAPSCRRPKASAQLALRRGASALPNLARPAADDEPARSAQAHPSARYRRWHHARLGRRRHSRADQERRPARRAPAARWHRFPAQRCRPHRMAPARCLELLYRERSALPPMRWRRWPAKAAGPWAGEAWWTAGLAAWRLDDCAGAAEAFEKSRDRAPTIPNCSPPRDTGRPRAEVRCRQPGKRCRLAAACRRPRRDAVWHARRRTARAEAA